jgi:murein DD-endopeptidase MepM/ murein hydrolase activator NlpD
MKRSALPTFYGVRRLLAKAIVACLPATLLLLGGASAAAETSAYVGERSSETGGFAYEPLPNQARPVNPGSIPGETGGSGYGPALQPQPSGTPDRRRRRPPLRQPASQLSSSMHRFPVLGEHSFGGADARFGARRPGHIHQGQDIVAAQGTPVAAPRGGTITWRAFQAEGAGYYLVLDAVMEPFNYVFMHLQRASLQVRVGDRVRTGQVLANVGSTGTSSGPHLHFEIWRGRWSKGGEPIDPLPALLAWDVLS